MASPSQDIDDPSHSISGLKQQPVASSEVTHTKRKRAFQSDNEDESAKLNGTNRSLSATVPPAGHDAGKLGSAVTPATEIDEEAIRDDPVNIVVEGDLVFIVGPHARRLKVHSLFLESCSCILKQIISSAKRSSVPSQTEILEIALPEDDEDAFEALCRHIHQANASSLTITVGLAKKVALLAKKYKCIENFVYAADYWLRNLSEPASKSGRTYWSLVVTALVFKNAEWFRKYSFRLLNSYRDSFLAFTEKCHDQLLGTRLALALEERRNSMVGYKWKLGVDATQWGLCLHCFLAADKTFARRVECQHCLEPPKPQTWTTAPSASSFSKITTTAGVFEPGEANSPAPARKLIFSSRAKTSGSSLFGLSSTPGTSTASAAPNGLFADSPPGQFPASTKNPFTGK